MNSSTTPIRHHLGSNPWIFLNPSCANALLLLFVGFVFIIDVIIISIHWNIGVCSNILKLWIIGKYFAPLFSYFSCCLFAPCNFDETIDVTTSIPYSQHALRHKRIRQSVLVNPITQIRKIQNEDTNINNNENRKKSSNQSHSRISLSPSPSFVSIPYPYDIMLSEWFVSPSTITSNIAQSIDNSTFCKIYIYFIGIIFDRGILELIWLFIGGALVISEDAECRNYTPILYFYVLLQIILGAFITIILLLWMISSSLCPLQVARLMACCYGMECDILGLLPRHLFRKLLTMHNSFIINQNNLYHEKQQQRQLRIQNINSNNKDDDKQQIMNQYEYEDSKQISKNYHTLSTVPHQYQNDVVELTTALSTTKNKKKMKKIKQNLKFRLCGMCNHEMEYMSGDSNILECGHEFHAVCIDAWPINLECPECMHQENRDNENKRNHVDDSDNELDDVSNDNKNTAQNVSKYNVNIQLL